MNILHVPFRMKQHFSTYEPMLKEIKQKYEVGVPIATPPHTTCHPSSFSLQTVTKEKMLACLERDRAVSEVSPRLHRCLHTNKLPISSLQVGCLQSTLQSVQSPTNATGKNTSGHVRDEKKQLKKTRVCLYDSNCHMASCLPCPAGKGISPRAKQPTLPRPPSCVYPPHTYWRTAADTCLSGT